MTLDQTMLLVILAAAAALFALGRWRHDLVALGALLAATLVGLVPQEAAFLGFGHPAVITVACMLALSRALQDSGAVDVVARRLLPDAATPAAMVAGLTGLAAALSAVMNNVGALALLMPLAIKAAARLDIPPGRLLMPLSFGSILGGMTTLIGTPPNIIVAGYRRDLTGEAFGMFDFTPVGLSVALAGTAFIALIGWRLTPARPREGVEAFAAGAYLTEARVEEGARADGMTLREIEREAGADDVQALGLVRRGVTLRAPPRGMRVRAGDILLLEAPHEGLATALASLGLTLEEAAPRPEAPAARDAPPRPAQEAAAAPSAPPSAPRAAPPSAPPSAPLSAAPSAPPSGDPSGPPSAPRPGDPPEPAAEPAAAAPPARDEAPEDDEVRLMELVAAPGAPILGRSARDIDLRARYRTNLLALSRKNRRRVGRIGDARIEAGDVLLVQGAVQDIAAFAADFGCLALAERPLRLPGRRDMRLAGGIFAASVAVAASGLLSAHVAFAGGLLAALATRTLSPRAVMRAVDWPVVTMLACLLPVADAMLSTGAAEALAGALVTRVAGGSPIVALAVILIVTMTLSDVMNNAATVAVMAPVAYGAAQTLGAPADAFFMAVAIGGSCAFLTPIGHQNNTLILGPGGFRFGDYWRMGLPLEIVVVAVATPLLALIWGV